MTADIYTAESQIKRPFELVGIISYDNPGKYRIMDLGDAMERLKEESRSVGGNAIIIDNPTRLNPALFPPVFT